MRQLAASTAPGPGQQQAAQVQCGQCWGFLRLKVCRCSISWVPAWPRARCWCVLRLSCREIACTQAASGKQQAAMAPGCRVAGCSQGCSSTPPLAPLTWLDLVPQGLRDTCGGLVLPHHVHQQRRAVAGGAQHHPGAGWGAGLRVQCTRRDAHVLIGSAGPCWSAVLQSVLAASHSPKPQCQSLARAR